MRLVDADKLIECTNSRYNEKKGIVPDNLAEGFMQMEKLIKEQPTAFDVDKVVEQLEERSKEYNSGVRLHGKPEEMLTDEAIEIVKRGGKERA